MFYDYDDYERNKSWTLVSIRENVVYRVSEKLPVIVANNFVHVIKFMNRK